MFAHNWSDHLHIGDGEEFFLSQKCMVAVWQIMNIPKLLFTGTQINTNSQQTHVLKEKV